MEIEREQIVEIAASIGAVGVMFALLYWIGAGNTTDQQLSETGGELLVYAIVFFILLMAAVGTALAFGITESDAANG